jgi:tellurite resistance protein
MLAEKKLSPAVSPEEALIYVMVMLSAADAHMTDRELAIIGDCVKHLPVFAAFAVDELPAAARACTAHLQAPDGMRHTLHLIRSNLPEHLLETAYALACDMAAADGKISAEERRLLELLRGELALDPLHSAAIERGARARYASV